MAGRRVPVRGFTGALAGMIAALFCAVLVLVASGRGLMGGRGPATVLEAICGPGGCRLMGREKAQKSLDLHAAQQSLAQLHRGRHHQKKLSALYPRFAIPFFQSSALSNKQRRGMLDDDEDDEEEPRQANLPAEPEGDAATGSGGARQKRVVHVWERAVLLFR